MRPRGYQLFVFCLGLIFVVLQERQCTAQSLLRHDSRQPVICYQGTTTRPDHVGISDELRKRRTPTSGRMKTATFEVEYVNFPDDNLAKAAFQYAVDIWEHELISSVPIRVRAEWRDLGAGVLGQALWGSAYANFGGEQHMNTFYPVALAEKIAARELNDATEPDIVASFNSNASWYLKTDGATPAGKMDLVTIVLHEIAHGLGFTDTYNVKEDGEATVGLTSGGGLVPFIFDVFVGEASGKNLLHEFGTPSTQLASALQSGNIFFNGALSVAALEGVRPELFAPAAFDKGSSISHLDEAVFNDSQDANRLMTPQIDFAESIHDPGDLLRAMLHDMGWMYTHIRHEALADTERKDGQPYVITASVRSDNAYDALSVKLHYTTDGINYTTAVMMPTGNPDEFRSSLPGTTTSRAYAYYLSVADSDERVFTNPGKIQKAGAAPEQGTHFFSIGTDTAAPEIVHQPVTYLFDYAIALPLEATVTDNQGVREVLVEYSLNNGSMMTIPMDPMTAPDAYAASAPLPDLVRGDIIRYRLRAVDVAASENSSTLPEGGFFEVAVTGPMPVQESYFNDFNEPSTDFFGNNFSISTPPGFADGAIHSDHPYANGSGPASQSHYTYQLQIPIRIRSDNPYIRFDEIVLIEPGEEGSKFGSSDFFDYAVVEGSVDHGVSWEPFADGYDSRTESVWLSRYNSLITNDNSEAFGDPVLFRPRTTNMLANGKFSAGDEVLIRFRLFADQLAHGWGWAIDNLSIQTPVTSVEDRLNQSAFRVYPTPTRAPLSIEMASVPGERVVIEIADLQGRIVYTRGCSAAVGDNLRCELDIHFLPGGLYIVKAITGSTIQTRKILKE